MITVHFHNMESDDFLIRVDDLNYPGRFFEGRLNGGQEFHTGQLQTDGKGYGSVAWTITNPANGAAAQGNKGGLTQGQQIDIYGT
jgi:hypothetical protein